MQERISKKQLVALFSSYLIGTTTIAFSSTFAGRASWIALVIAASFGMGALWLWSKVALSWQEPLIDGLVRRLGNFWGSIISLCYLFYFLILASLILSNISAITIIAFMPETPPVVIKGAFLFTVLLATRGGIECLGRLAELLFPSLLVVTVLSGVLVLSTPDLIRWDYLLPLFDIQWRKLFQASWATFAFPFGATVLFSSILPLTTDAKAGRRYLFLSHIAVALIFVCDSLLQIAVFGSDIQQTVFPGLSLVRGIRVANFLTRLEGASVFVWGFGAFLKLGICCWNIAAGLMQLFKLSHYRPLLFPLGLVICTISLNLFTNYNKTAVFGQFIYPILSLPFQVLFPLVLYLLSLKTTKP